MLTKNSSVHNTTLHIFNVERYVGWGCILNCFLLSSLPCVYAFCWSTIPTSCYKFNVFSFLYSIQCSVECKCNVSVYTVSRRNTFGMLLAHLLNLMAGLTCINLSSVKMILCSLHVCKKWVSGHSWLNGLWKGSHLQMYLLLSFRLHAVAVFMTFTSGELKGFHLIKVSCLGKISKLSINEKLPWCKMHILTLAIYELFCS